MDTLFWATIGLNFDSVNSEPALFEYLLSKHVWGPNVIDAHTYSSTEVHLLKLVHDKLPLRRQVSRHQEWMPAACHYCSAPDAMDHLQTGVCNPTSSKFQVEIRASVRKYLTHRQCPKVFITRFMKMIDSWLCPTLGTQPNDTAANSQATIGLRLLTRGFLTCQWRQALCDSLRNHDYQKDSPRDHALIGSIAGLIKVMWKLVGKLWLDHLQVIHETTKSHQSPVTLVSLQTRVWFIHALKPDTQPIHAHHYFHSDLKAFLQKSNIQALETYIQHYLPPIMSSIHQANNTRSYSPPHESRQTPDSTDRPIHPATIRYHNGIVHVDVCTPECYKPSQLGQVVGTLPPLHLNPSFSISLLLFHVVASFLVFASTPYVPTFSVNRT
jgi:hypothetical protein